MERPRANSHALHVPDYARINSQRPDRLQILETPRFFDPISWVRGVLDFGVEGVHAADEFRKLLKDRVWRGEGIPQGDGKVVILIQGVAVPAFPFMWPMTDWLKRAGYSPYLLPSTFLTNSWAPDVLARDVITTVQMMVERSGQKVDVLGHSWGGYGVHATAKLYPDECSQYINHMVVLGAPTNAPIKLNPWIDPAYRLATRLGRFIRGGKTESELMRQFGNNVTIEAPDGVRMMIIESVRDGVVEGKGDGNGQYKNSNVTKYYVGDRLHLSLVVNRHVFRALGDFLAQKEVVEAAMTA